MPKLIIDNKEYDAKQGRNCLEAALEHDLDLPYFCYHPALGAVGACRLCAVKVYKDEADTHGRVVMSCMEPVADGKRLSIADPEASEFRKWILEWLMINHPHDCPICDEGGECHLQDMTVMTGHRTRRYRGKKRTYNNQYLGPLINHEMNRCIQCYRCVRYYQDYAGGDDLVVMKQRSNVYFGRHEDGILQSPFSGNLIDICPTGVFTDKTLKDHYTRKWDQETAPSLCTQCGLGCNTIPAARYGKLRRILPRYNEEVNGYFICDRGRFGYQFNNAEERLREPLIQHNGTHRETDRTEAWDRLQDFCQADGKVAGIGSTHASLEANYALQCLVGEENFSSGLCQEDHELTSAGLDVYQNGSCAPPTLQEVEQADAILILGADVTHEIPRHDLAIRQAVKNGASLWIAACRATPLDEVASARVSRSPQDLVQSADHIREQLFQSSKTETFEADVAKALGHAKRPVILVGWYHGRSDLFRMAGAIAQSLQDKKKEARLLIAFPEANSCGVGLLGGCSVNDILENIEQGQIQRLIVLENELINRVTHGLRLQAALNKLERILVLAHSESVTTSLATDVLPVATPVESNGTWVNAEGRAQRAYQVYRPEPWVPQSWELLRDLPDAQGRNRQQRWPTPDAVIVDLAADKSIFKEAVGIAPPASYRQHGQKIGRMSHRYSGRTALPSIEDVRDHLLPPEDSETPFSFSMEGSPKEPPSSLIPRFWTPNWNSQEAINKFQIELGLGLHGGAPGVRLIEPEIGRGAPWRAPIGEGAASSAPTERNQILLVPSAEIFGSEPTSRQAKAIQELVPEPYLELHPETAQALGVTSGVRWRIRCLEQQLELLVRTNETVAPGIAVIPARFPETRHLLAPVVATVEGPAS